MTTRTKTSKSGQTSHAHGQSLSGDDESSAIARAHRRQLTLHEIDRRDDNFLDIRHCLRGAGQITQTSAIRRARLHPSECEVWTKRLAVEREGQAIRTPIRHRDAAAPTWGRESPRSIRREAAESSGMHQPRRSRRRRRGSVQPTAFIASAILGASSSGCSPRNLTVRWSCGSRIHERSGASDAQRRGRLGDRVADFGREMLIARKSRTIRVGVLGLAQLDGEMREAVRSSQLDGTTTHRRRARGSRRPARESLPRAHRTLRRHSGPRAHASARSSSSRERDRHAAGTSRAYSLGARRRVNDAAEDVQRAGAEAAEIDGDARKAGVDNGRAKSLAAPGLRASARHR